MQSGGGGSGRPLCGTVLWFVGSSHLTVHLQSPGHCSPLRLPLLLSVLPDLRDASLLGNHGVSAGICHFDPSESL